jgi:hypothetical protein
MEQRSYNQPNQNWIDAASQAWEARRLRMLYEKAENRAFDQLKQLSNNLPSKAGDFIFDFSERKGMIDYTLIPELQAIDLERYRKGPVVTWKLEKIINVVANEKSI